MASEYCDALSVCNLPAGRVTLSPIFIGPRFATRDQKYVLPWFHGRLALCPYIRVIYEQIWEPKELCRGPVRSVLGLAPGESIVTEVRQIEQVDFTHTVRRGFESTETTSFMRPATEVATSGSGPRSWVGDVARALVSTAGVGRVVDSAILFKPCVVTGWNLNWGGAIGAFIGGAVAGPLGAVAGAFVGDAVGDFVGGGSGSSQVADAVDQNLASITRTQTQYNATETTRGESTITERSISRSFSNPYRDRAIDLRFLSVFRRYEVTTRIVRFEFGLTFCVTEPRFDLPLTSARLSTIVDERLLDPRIRALIESDFVDLLPSAAAGGAAAAPRGRAAAQPKRPAMLAEHFDANAEHYSRVVLAHLFRRGTPAVALRGAIETLEASVPRQNADAVLQSLNYNAAYTVDECVFLPVPEIEKLRKWPGFDPRVVDKLKELPPWVPPARLPQLPMPTKRDVHLFIGTQIEAAAGTCVLPNVP